MKDDRIELEGKMYISSADAARDMKYTKDYIGQLARAGKIDAKLIGRSWYVAEESLKEHKGSVHYTLTKTKKRRAPSGSRETEKVILHIDNSEHRHSVEAGRHGVDNPSREDPVATSATPPVKQDTVQEIPVDDALPLLVPIRTEHKRQMRDVLVSSHIEYEPGEPLYFDDTRSARPQARQPARFMDAPIHHERSVARVQEPPQQRRMLEREVSRGVRPAAPHSGVRMDGVLSDVRTPPSSRPVRQRPQYVEMQRGRRAEPAEISSYGKVGEKRRRGIPWLTILVTLFIMAGIGLIVWILFAV